jgi:hypothetical protein
LGIVVECDIGIEKRFPRQFTADSAFRQARKLEVKAKRTAGISLSALWPIVANQDRRG